MAGRVRRVKPKMASPKAGGESTIKKFENIFSGLFRRKPKTKWHQGRLDNAVQFARQNPAKGRRLLEAWENYLSVQLKKNRISRQQFAERDIELDALRNAIQGFISQKVQVRRRAR